MSLDEEDVFAPLALSATKMVDDYSRYYRVYRANGEVVTVEAVSATEALEKTGITDAVKIINQITEQRRVLQNNVISPHSETIDTNPTEDLSDQPTSLAFLFVENISEIEQMGDAAAFEGMNLRGMAELFGQDAESAGIVPLEHISEDDETVDITPSDDGGGMGIAEAMALADEEEAEEAANPTPKEPNPAPKPVEVAAEEAEPELTPEQVRNLLNAEPEDSDDSFDASDVE